MKVNIGCGNFPQPGWINVDANNEPDHGLRPDVVGTIFSLPFRSESVEAVYLGHVLEHLPLDLVPKALQEVERVLEYGGRVAVVGPDINRARVEVAAGRQPESLIVDVAAGGERWNGDRHWWTCEQSLIMDFLNEMGLSDVTELSTQEIEDLGFPVTSHAAWQCSVAGVK